MRKRSNEGRAQSPGKCQSEMAHVEWNDIERRCTWEEEVHKMRQMMDEHSNKEKEEDEDEDELQWQISWTTVQMQRPRVKC